MSAVVLVRYLAPTDTKGARLRAVADGIRPTTEHRDYEVEPYDQAGDLAGRYAQLVGISDGGMRMSRGSLPNGDWIFIFERADA